MTCTAFASTGSGLRIRGASVLPRDAGDAVEVELGPACEIIQHAAEFVGALAAALVDVRGDIATKPVRSRRVRHLARAARWRSWRSSVISVSVASSARFEFRIASAYEVLGLTAKNGEQAAFMTPSAGSERPQAR